MTIQSKPFYWLTCDAPGCEAKSTDESEYAAWADHGYAESEAEDSGWTFAGGMHYCQDHVIPICDECDEHDNVILESVPDEWVCADCKAKVNA